MKTKIDFALNGKTEPTRLCCNFKQLQLSQHLKRKEKILESEIRTILRNKKTGKGSKSSISFSCCFLGPFE